MKTTLHHYRIDISISVGWQEYQDLKHRIEADCPEARGHWMKATQNGPWSKTRTDSETIEIQTDHVFDNQWNETTRRVFDWYEEVCNNKSIKRGHWIEITSEMAQLRQETHKCGYCGAQYGPWHKPIPESGFCFACLDSPYLKSEELHLLHLLPLVGPQIRDPLSDNERASITPQYVDRQTTGADSQAKAKRDKQKEDVWKKYYTTRNTNEIEQKGMVWLWDRSFDLENVIYYDHTGKFGFGWRSPVDSAVLSKLLDEISEFPYPYEIKTDDGQTLSG